MLKVVDFHLQAGDFHADLAFFVGSFRRGGLLAAALLGKDVPAGDSYLSGRQATFSIGEPGSA